MRVNCFWTRKNAFFLIIKLGETESMDFDTATDGEELCGWTLACCRVAWHWQVSTFLSLLSTLSAADWCNSSRLALTCIISQKSNLKGDSVHWSGRIFHECPVTPAGGHFSWPCWEHPLGRMGSDILALGTHGWNWNDEGCINLALSQTLLCSTCCTHTLLNRTGAEPC